MAAPLLRLVGLLVLGCAGADPGSAAPAATASRPSLASCVERVQQSGAAARRNEPKGPQNALPTIVLTVEGTDLLAEVADDPSERASGLMFRDALAPDAGMVFVYPRPKPLSFWMRNTCVPLSIAYIDTEGRIVSIADMTPLDESGVPSGAAALYALEMEQGWFARKGVSVGARVVGLPPASTY